MKKSIILAVLFITMSIFAESNKLGISGKISLFDNISSEIGLRLHMSEKIGIDFGFGMNIETEVEKDSASDTDKREGQTEWSARIGLAGNIYQKNNVKIYLLGNFMVIKHDDIYNWVNMDDNNNNSLGNKYFKTTLYYKEINISVEPNYFFADNFSIYSLFGLAVGFSPNSLYADPEATYKTIDDEIKTKERKDSNTNIAIVNPMFNLGLRFYF